MHFTPQEESRIRAAAEQLEARTGVQVLAAVIGKADHYPEVPWKAFAMAASLATLVLTIQSLLDPPWLLPVNAAVDALVALAVGAVAALIVPLLSPLARRFVSRTRRAGEVEQYARALFLERELFGTPERKAVLLLISLFERQAVLLPDTGLAVQLNADALAPVLARMSPPLARGRRAEAVLTGLAALESALLAAGCRGVAGTADTIPEEFVEDEGVES